MSDNISVFMPIRLNSQRIKNKSIVDVMGRPMFCWSLETLDKIGTKIYVYTNEEDVLMRNIDFSPSNIEFVKRPKYLDEHKTRGIDIYKEFSKQVVSDVYMLVHCTSPFVNKSTYEKVISAVTLEGYDSSCTVEKRQTFSWYKEKPINFSIPRQRTQELEPLYIENSAAYCYRSKVLESNSRSGKKHKLIVSKGIENIDIDEECDLEFSNNREFRRW